MKKPVKFLLFLPESYLILLSFIAGFNPPFSIHPISLILIAIVLLQLIFRNTITGILLASSFVMVNIYMSLAMLSELNEFPTFNSAAVKLLTVGSLLVLANLFIAGLMIYNYLIANKKIIVV